MSSGVHRKRLACVECTRRKVKCDKILPCRNCTKKRTACTRPRERASPNSDDDKGSERCTPNPSVPASNTIHRLQSKIQRLESALKENTRPQLQRNQSQNYDSSPTAGPHCAYEDTPRNNGHSPVWDSDETPTEVEDAATILEFLAWGRRKDPTYQDTVVRDNNIDHSPGDTTVDEEWIDPFQGSSASSVCPLLLPSRQKVHQLVNYHCECLLWYHGSFHATTFKKELNEFYDRDGGQIGCFGANLQWFALLFAILTGSMTCATRSTAQSWGFRKEEQASLSKTWLKATTACLQQADFMAHHSLFSVEAIATLTISAHMLGYSNGLSVLLASAVRVAQGLGLHQLGDDQHDKADVNREIGRRAWCQLCIQDWFSIPFTESYLIHRLGFNTKKPRNRTDSMEILPESQPTVASYSRLFYEIAALMPSLQDDISGSNTPYTKYEQMLKYDRQLRNLATQHLPYHLQNVSLHPSWPCYVPWARRCLAISSAHKVIMIHRKFLSLSFVNPMFNFTRKTCVAAARTIIKEQQQAAQDEEPVLWIHHAFSVTASIILCLDLFHQTGPSRENSDHRQLINDVIHKLSHSEADMISKRGITLLRAMLAEEEDRRSEIRPRRVACNRMASTQQADMLNTQYCNGLNIPAIIRKFYRQDRVELRRRTPIALPPPDGGSYRLESWSEMMRDSTEAVPGIEMFASLSADGVSELDQILNLATNYIS